MRAHAAALLMLCYVATGYATHTADGDTFDARFLVDVWHGQAAVAEDRIRVEGVNTPERGQPGYQEAKDFTTAWLARGPFTVRTCERDRARRAVGVVTRGTENLAAELITRKLGVPFLK